MTKKRDYYVHNGRIGLFILSWSTVTGYSASILSQLVKNWLVSDSSFFDSWHNISADIQWHWITTRWITLQYPTVFVLMIEERSSWNSLYIKADKLTSTIFVHQALHWAFYLQIAQPRHFLFFWTVLHKLPDVISHGICYPRCCSSIAKMWM